MKLRVKKLPQSKVELEIEVEEKDFREIFERVFFDLRKRLQIPGFRKGKVPKEIALREIGEEKILMETARQAVKENYQKAISSEKLEPISRPEIEILKLTPKNPFCFRASFPILPEIELPDYKKISSKIERKRILVEEAEIEEALNWLQKSRPKFKEVSKIAKKGDFVEIEFSCTQIENGKMQKDAFLLGKGHLIPGFEENLEGMRPGQKKSFSLCFPEKHFQKDLAGKGVEFEVEMKSVKEVDFPEINDQFAREIGSFKDLSSLKESIREGLKLEKEMAETQRVRNLILEKIAQDSKLEIPEILIESEKERMLENSKKRVLENLKIPFPEYLTKIKKSEKDLLDSFSTLAQKRVKNFLILREISKRENIEVSEEEIRNETNEILKKYPPEKTKGLDLEGLKAYTEGVIRNGKTLAKLESFAHKD